MALVTLIKVKGLHKRNQSGVLDPRSHLGAEANRVSDLWPGHGAVPSPFWQYEYYQPSFCRRAQRAFCTISFFPWLWTSPHSLVSPRSRAVYSPSFHRLGATAETTHSGSSGDLSSGCNCGVMHALRKPGCLYLNALYKVLGWPCSSSNLSRTICGQSGPEKQCQSCMHCI